MGLATYDDLKAAVADWLDREDLAGRTGDFITLAEAAPFLRDGEMLAVFAARFDAALTEARMREARIASPAPLRVDPAVAVLPGWRA